VNDEACAGFSPGVCLFDKACATGLLDRRRRAQTLREAGRDGWLATDWLLQGAVPCKVGLLPRANTTTFER
jgi:hypothetical protein